MRATCLVPQKMFIGFSRGGDETTAAYGAIRFVGWSRQRARTARVAIPISVQCFPFGDDMRS